LFPTFEFLKFFIKSLTITLYTSRSRFSSFSSSSSSYFQKTHKFSPYGFDLDLTEIITASRPYTWGYEHWITGERKVDAGEKRKGEARRKEEEDV